MQVRRIVAGINSSGRSVFLSDGPTPRAHAFEHVPGFVTSLIWETPSMPTLSAVVEDPSLSAPSWIPPAGGTNVMFVTFPPDSVMTRPGFDPAAAGSEYMAKLPGLAECFEPTNPGMHTTHSVDYDVLIKGEIHLELDDGITKKLMPGDVVIQNGNRHAWRNKSDEPATMLFVLLGARRP